MASKRTSDHSPCFPAPKKRKVSSCFASSSSSTQSRWSYDVFLSFRGEDTRKNFTDHLFEALVQAGIRTFRDDDELPRGCEISSELLKSIEESRISIVVFSRNYASSRWCLDELVKIIECKKTLGQLVLPIFYGVCPSDVRKQTGYFGEAFGRHEKRFVDEMEKVEVRRAALYEAANLSGWDLQNVANGHEAKFIRKIVKEVLCELKHTFLNIAMHPIGIDSRVKKARTEAVEGVIMTLPMLKKIQWSNKVFAGMPKLRLLRIDHVHLCGNFKHLFEELRWLCWQYCPLESLPSNFRPEKLLVLDMQFSSFKTLWMDGKHFKSLKILNLSNSKCLTKSPIFCALPMLDELLLESCTGLMELHESIGLLDKLVHLNLKDCMNLRYLLGSICKLKSVKHINLTSCAKLEEFPKHLGHMESLTELLADGTTIKQLHFSIGLLKNLRTLLLKGCNMQLTTKSWFSLISSWVLQRKNADSIRFLPSTVSGLCSLTKLDLSNRNLSEGDFPVDFGSLSLLRVLKLDGNNFRSLPYGFSHLSKLEDLGLDNCTSLQSISDLPPNLLDLYAYNCASLQKISDLSKLKNLVVWLSNPQFEQILSNRYNDGMEDPHHFQGVQIIPLDMLNKLNNLQNPLQ
ncbi:unnamed protein product [Camellia sinensis]